MAASSFKPLDLKPDASRSAALSLGYPVQLADRRLEEVTMRRPNMGDLLDHEPKGPDDVATEMELIGALCGLKISEMRLLDSTDYARLQDQYVRFRAVPKS